MGMTADAVRLAALAAKAVITNKPEHAAQAVAASEKFQQDHPDDPSRDAVGDLSAADIVMDLVAIADGGTSGEFTYHLDYNASRDLSITVKDEAGGRRAFQVACIDVREVTTAD